MASLEEKKVKLGEIAAATDSELLAGDGESDVRVERFIGSNRISALLCRASDKTLIVTSLSGTQLLRVAQLMEVPGICLADGLSPDIEFVQKAAASGLILIKSPFSIAEICRRLLEEIGMQGEMDDCN